MDAFELAAIPKSVYQGECFVIATKHHKSIALAPAFSSRLGVGMMEYYADTDKLGTFSGTTQRKLSPIEAAKQKCLWVLERTNADFAIGSEGGFHPHPDMPFINANHEVLYFMDRRNNIEIYETSISTKIHYFSEIVSSQEELLNFAKQARFPSHGILLCPFPKHAGQKFFQEITSFEKLIQHFNEAKKLSTEGKVWVETELRAHLNPTRMKHIEQLGHQLIDRLISHCPQCKAPGWGQKKLSTGLPCKDCGSPTNAIAAEMISCSQCQHIEEKSYMPGENADPRLCPVCNP